MNCSDSLNGVGQRVALIKTVSQLMRSTKVSLEKAMDMIGLTGSECKAVRKAVEG